MANGQISGPPAVNFYSMLSGLGDQIAANQKQAAIKSALDTASQPGVSYGDAIRGLVAAGATPQAQLYATLQAHQDALAHQSTEDARAAENDKFSHNIQTQQLAISKQNADRLNESPLDKANERMEALKANNIDPNSPEGQGYLLTGTYTPSTKPVPFETIGGTKFMVRQPNGGYGVVDPSNLNQPQQPQAPAPNAPAPQPQGMPGAPPSPQALAPPQAPGAPPPASTAPAPDLSTVDPNTGRREGYLKSLPPDAQEYIKRIADYQIDPRTTSIKGGMRERIMSAVAQYDPTYDQNTFSSRAKAIKDFSTGQQGNAIRSFDVATDHLETLKKYVVALNSGNIPAINALRNAYLQETGSSLPTNVQAVGPIVGAEVSKAIIGSNNALADREELRKPLLGKGATDQILGSIQAYQELMTGQLRGLKKQYEDTTGKKDFDTRIRPNTKNVLLGDVGSPSQPNVTSTGIKWSIQ